MLHAPITRNWRVPYGSHTLLRADACQLGLCSLGYNLHFSLIGLWSLGYNQHFSLNGLWSLGYNLHFSLNDKNWMPKKMVPQTHTSTFKDVCSEAGGTYPKLVDVAVTLTSLSLPCSSKFLPCMPCMYHDSMNIQQDHWSELWTFNKITDLNHEGDDCC